MILDAVEICKNINGELSTFIYNIIRIIKLGVPIILVIIGMVDFGKGVYAAKEDEIVKARKTFIKRIIAGAAVFLMITLTQLVISVLDKNSSGQIWECANKIMNGEQIIIDEDTEKNNDDQEQIPDPTDEERKIIHCCVQSSGSLYKGKCTNDTTEKTEIYNKCMAE